MKKHQDEFENLKTHTFININTKATDLIEICSSLPYSSTRHKKKINQISEILKSLCDQQVSIFNQSEDKMIDNTNQLYLEMKRQLEKENIEIIKQNLEILRNYDELKKNNIEIEKKYTKILLDLAIQENKYKNSKDMNIMFKKEFHNIKKKLVNSMYGFVALQNKYESHINQKEKSTDLFMEKFINLQNKYLSEINLKKEIKNKSGAIDLVKNSLTYKIGSIFVKKTSIKDYEKIPFEIIKEMKDFLIKKIHEDIANLEYLDEYLDQNQAQLYKQHLSYRLGKVFLEKLILRKDVKTLPSDFLDEIIAFKKSKYLELN
ncbi:hypothetical protein [Acinetobacter soli]|uniref:hypothetical protein n=1 Tax=Acinetobacter soli TaxID=487316 RepID=UPI00124E464C|nr:hypothetical protein [Acinetobacter soli]